MRGTEIEYATLGSLVVGVCDGILSLVDFVRAVFGLLRRLPDPTPVVQFIERGLGAQVEPMGQDNASRIMLGWDGLKRRMLGREYWRKKSTKKILMEVLGERLLRCFLPWVALPQQAEFFKALDFLCKRHLGSLGFDSRSMSLLALEEEFAKRKNVRRLLKLVPMGSNENGLRAFCKMVVKSWAIDLWRKLKRLKAVSLEDALQTTGVWDNRVETPEQQLAGKEQEQESKLLVPLFIRKLKDEMTPKEYYVWYFTALRWKDERIAADLAVTENHVRQLRFRANLKHDNILLEFGRRGVDALAIGLMLFLLPVIQWSAPAVDEVHQPWSAVESSDEAVSNRTAEEPSVEGVHAVASSAEPRGTGSPTRHGEGVDKGGTTDLWDFEVLSLSFGVHGGSGVREFSIVPSAPELCQISRNELRVRVLKDMRSLLAVQPYARKYLASPKSFRVLANLLEIRNNRSYAKPWGRLDPSDRHVGTLIPLRDTTLLDGCRISDDLGAAEAAGKIEQPAHCVGMQRWTVSLGPADLRGHQRPGNQLKLYAKSSRDGLVDRWQFGRRVCVVMQHSQFSDCAPYPSDQGFQVTGLRRSRTELLSELELQLRSMGHCRRKEMVSDSQAVSSAEVLAMTPLGERR